MKENNLIDLAKQARENATCLILNLKLVRLW